MRQFQGIVQGDIDEVLVTGDLDIVFVDPPPREDKRIGGKSHLRRALESLSEEGVTQLFRPMIGADLIVGAVGALQFEVLVERVQDEYGIAVAFEPAPYAAARWISADDPAALQAFIDKNQSLVALDIDESPVFLAKNLWELGYVQEKNPGLVFSDSRERELG